MSFSLRNFRVEYNYGTNYSTFKIYTLTGQNRFNMLLATSNQSALFQIRLITLLWNLFMILTPGHGYTKGRWWILANLLPWIVSTFINFCIRWSGSWWMKIKRQFEIKFYLQKQFRNRHIKKFDSDDRLRINSTDVDWTSSIRTIFECIFEKPGIQSFYFFVLPY